MHEIVSETITTTRYQFHDMADNVDESLGYDQRNCGSHFTEGALAYDDWHKAKGYPELDAEGKATGSSQIWWAEYKAEIADGSVIEVPYLDFWHWQMEVCLDGELYNGSTNELYIGLDTKKMYKQPEDWQMAIQKKYNELFSDIAKDDWVTVHLYW